jgi:amino acid adenylation domain-containing protein
MEDRTESPNHGSLSEGMRRRTNSNPDSDAGGDDIRRQALSYWTRTFVGASALELPVDRLVGSTEPSTASIDRIRQRFPTALKKQLENVGRQQHVSLFAVLFGSWALLLARWCAQEELVVGARWTRRLPNGELRVEGADIPVPLRLAVDEHMPVKELLKRADRVLAEAIAHSNVSMNDVRAAIQRSDGERPLVRALIAFDDARAWASMNFKDHSEKCESPPIDLAFVVEEVDGIWTGSLEYRQDLFDRDTVSRIADSFNTLLHAIVKHTRRPVGQLGLLSRAQRDRVIYENNATAVDYPRDKLIHQLFEAEASRVPAALALACREETLNYAQLNERANQLAHYLRRRGVGRRDRVGICLQRSVDSVVAILGALKAGAAYVPLDPGYTIECLAYQLEDAVPAVVITHSKLKARLPQAQTHLIALDELSEEIAREDHRNLAHKELTSEDLACLIYTPGSTEQPKGVMVRHRNVVNYATCAVRQFDIEHGDGSLTGTSMSFDPALTGFYPPLICGRAVTLCAEHGPTEATMGRVVREVSGGMEGPVPIGKRIANTRIYVLNAYRSPMPVGAVGEIYIGGDGVAAGYWNRPELTAERFLSDPFSSDPNACMFKTGDLGRWRPDGTIEYLSRNDSRDVLLVEASTYMERRAGERAEPLASRNFVAQALSGSQAAEAEEFFRSKLGDVDEPTAPFGLIDGRSDASQIEQAQRVVEEALAGRARTAARELGVNAATLFHVVWALVIARCSGRDDVVFGSVLSARLPVEEAERASEMFLNTLPLRLKLAGVSAKQLVRHAHSELTELREYAQASLVLAQRCSALDGDAPLFNCVLGYQNDASNPVNAAASGGLSEMRLIDAGGRTNYPYSLFVDDFDEAFSITVQTEAGVDPHRVSNYVYTALESLVRAMEDSSERAVLELAVLPPSERREVLEEFNATRAEYAGKALIHELVEAQVRKTPQAIAVAYEGEQLTYEQLNERANQLAHYLRERGVGPDQFVGICVERSLEMVVGLLGILKAGGAYVPLDPSYPFERLEHMLKDAAPKVLLTLERLRKRLPETAAEVIAVDADWQKIAERPVTDVESRKTGMHSGNLAYVIYTSGSTGQPKGVLVEHGSVINLWGGLERLYRQSAPCKHVALNASLNFDASVQQLVQLLSGRRLSIVPQEYRLNAHKLLSFIEAHQIDAIDCTPSQLKVWVDGGMLDRKYPHMVLVGGEAIDAELWRKLGQCTEKRFFNVYGPTECTVDATACRLDPDSEPTIGRPLDNTQIYILDERGEPLPIGVTGELYIGGAGVARGYLNRAELTAARFLKDPFSADATARMYRTGDLGRWRADGTIEHLGRNDDQVKIRGFRIELGEIGTRLSEHELVREAAVIAREFTPGNTRLVAYITAAGERQPDPQILRSHLTGVLPDYMIPAAFVVLERLPLTQSGKLDRRALPSPAADDFAKREYAAPRGRMEEAVANIWRSLLNTDRIGRDDNFFELGGHSLLLVQLAERLRSGGLSAEVFNIYRASTLGGFAATLTDADTNASPPLPNRIPVGCESISPEMLPLIEIEADHIARIVSAVPGGAANIQDIYPLASLQEGILFHHLLHAGGADPYVFSSLLSVACLERLNEVIRAFQSVIDRHDVLRTAILWEDLPNPVQVVCRTTTLPVEEIALDSTRDVREQLDEWLAAERQSMDIRQAPLVRMKVAADPWSEQWYVIVQVHHIGIDYQSMATLLREAMTCLQGRAATLAEPLPYRNHVARTRALAQLQDAEAFFRSKLGDVDETTAPFGLLDTRGDASRVDEFHASVDLSLGKRVRAQARRLGTSPATLFHAAWALVVAQTSGRDDVVFGTVLMGRMQAVGSIDRALGMFINTLPMRVALRDLTVRELVGVTQQELVELLQHEQVSLSVVQRCSGVSAGAPLFTALLNYVHNTLGFDADDDCMGEGVHLLERRQWSNFPIVVSVEDKPDGFLVTAQTDRKVDPRRIATYLLIAMESLVCALEFAPQSMALQLALLPEEERRRVIVEFNATERAYPHEQRVHEWFEEMPRAMSLPIGHPIGNAAIYILNSAMQPVPIGAVGEIYIGGAGVALEFINRPEMTSQQFVPDVFAQTPGARLYKTGDLGRWREDGNVEFVARTDQQVKVRARLPLTSNGKRDPHAQPAPELAAFVSQPHEPPMGEIEQIVAAIWCELLRLERIGRHDHFFELGGHSLLAMQVMVRIRSQLSLDVAISELFDNPTLAKFAARVAEQREQVLLERLDIGGAEVDALLEQVASMSEHEIDELMVQLRAGGRL